MDNSLNTLGTTPKLIRRHRVERLFDAGMVIGVGTAFGTLAIAVADGDEPLWPLPMISDGGVDYPEASVMSRCAC